MVAKMLARVIFDNNFYMHSQSYVKPISIGDSGGPLFCQSASSSSTGYLAGIISRGSGCGQPRSPGTYTNVAMHLEWIAKANSGDLNPNITIPKQQCPGFKCQSGDGNCLPRDSKCNRVVDCFDAEDEDQRDYTTFDLHFFICSESVFTQIDPEKWINCSSEPKILENRLRCNGREDCHDGSNEQGCTSRPLSTAQAVEANSTTNNEVDSSEAVNNWPWTATIYLNGHYACLGLLLNTQWVLADKRCIR